MRSNALARKFRVGILILDLVLLAQPVIAAPSTPETRSEEAVSHHRAFFGRHRASGNVRHVADWIVDSADNAGLPFVVLDKVDAKIFVFDEGGRILGASPALIGSARGDHSVPGIGDREYSDMSPEDRTTPSGRFVATVGRNARGEDVVWVDYEAAISMHRVLTTKPEERRLERLATPTPLDNRISYGCINLPARFYEQVVRPLFSSTNGVVYVLPETQPISAVFGTYDVAERLRRRDADETQAAR